MDIDAQNTESLQMLCTGLDSCDWTEITCPHLTANACRFIGNDTTYFKPEIYVDEGYVYGFLDWQCTSSIANNCTLPLDINCEGDQDIIEEEIKWNMTTNAYYCDIGGGGASYCCPLRSCSIFNGSAMSFDVDSIAYDTELDDYTQYIMVNNTGELLQNTINCTDTNCMIHCRGLLSCAFTTINVDSNVVIIECEDGFSCLGATVIFTADLIQNVTVLCLSTFGLYFLNFKIC